jgi:hypothetical protein
MRGDEPRDFAFSYQGSRADFDESELVRPQQGIQRGATDAEPGGGFVYGQ